MVVAFAASGVALREVYGGGLPHGCAACAITQGLSLEGPHCAWIHALLSSS